MALDRKFSPQPETLRYLNYVAEKFDLRQHAVRCRVEAMVFDEQANFWTLTLTSGRQITTDLL